MRLRVPLRAFATALLWGSVSHATPLAETERPEALHEKTFSEAGSGLEATSPRPDCTTQSSTCAVVFLDHEADVFIFPDSSDGVAAGAVELSVDWELFDDLDSPVGFNDIAGFSGPS